MIEPDPLAELCAGWGGGHQFEVYLQGSTASQNALGVNQINDSLGFRAKFLVEDEGQVKQVVAA